MQLLLSSKFSSLNFFSSFPNICHFVDRIQHQLDITHVRMNKPNFGEFMLNVDGCCKGNPGNADGGGILRDYLGHMIMEFTVYLG